MVCNAFLGLKIVCTTCTYVYTAVGPPAMPPLGDTAYHDKNDMWDIIAAMVGRLRPFGTSTLNELEELLTLICNAQLNDIFYDYLNI